MMENLDRTLEETDDKRCRMKLLSVAIGTFTEKEVISNRLFVLILKIR